MSAVQKELLMASHLRRGTRKPVGVWPLIQWAFQAECASLDLGEGPRTVSGTGYVMAQLEVGRVDGGGHSLPHHDADLVADALAQLPEARGGRRMAVWIAEMARAGAEPDWMPDACPRVVPVDTHTNRWGVRAKTAETGEVVARRNRKGVIVHDRVQYCPVLIRPTASDIARARRGWFQWWDALWDVRETFRIYDNLTCHVVTDDMPEREPWKKKLLDEILALLT